MNKFKYILLITAALGFSLNFASYSMEDGTPISMEPIKVTIDDRFSENQSVQSIQYSISLLLQEHIRETRQPLNPDRPVIIALKQNYKRVTIESKVENFIHQ